MLANFSLAIQMLASFSLRLTWTFATGQVAPYIQQGSQLFNHPNSKLLTFVSITQRFPQEPEYNLDHVVGTPYFGRTHWNRFSMASESQPVSLAQLETGRDKFVVASFGVRRYADRFAAHRWGPQGAEVHGSHPPACH